MRKSAGRCMLAARCTPARLFIFNAPAQPRPSAQARQPARRGAVRASPNRACERARVSTPPPLGPDARRARLKPGGLRRHRAGFRMHPWQRTNVQFAARRRPDATRPPFTASSAAGADCRVLRATTPEARSWRTGGTFNLRQPAQPSHWLGGWSGTQIECFLHRDGPPNLTPERHVCRDPK